MKLDSCASGLVVVELFAGMCSGLEALLATGHTVKTYVYCDPDNIAQQIAKFRLKQLRVQYPTQISYRAVSQAFTTWPQDLRMIGEKQLALIDEINVVIAG